MKLNRRETIFVTGGAAILIILAFYFIVVEPLASARDKLGTTAKRLEGELAEMRNLSAQYKAVASVRTILESQVQNRGSDFAPFSYLENVARETGITGQIESMTPVVSTTEEGSLPMAQFDVRLSGIKLLELVRFLYKLESSDKIFFVENLSIRPRYLKPDTLDVTLRLASPKAA